jgi:hypothetical protein
MHHQRRTFQRAASPQQKLNTGSSFLLRNIQSPIRRPLNLHPNLRH